MCLKERERGRETDTQKRWRGKKTEKERDRCRNRWRWKQRLSFLKIYRSVHLSALFRKASCSKCHLTQTLIIDPCLQNKRHQNTKPRCDITLPPHPVPGT